MLEGLETRHVAAVDRGNIVVERRPTKTPGASPAFLEI
jgi:hypothetical protein